MPLCLADDFLKNLVVQNQEDVKLQSDFNSNKKASMVKPSIFQSKELWSWAEFDRGGGVGKKMQGLRNIDVFNSVVENERVAGGKGTKTYNAALETMLEVGPGFHSLQLLSFLFEW